ncbi:hypothetical protein MP228_008686 [Amoeboaphelidium protococcarum]|nr:hypothetical protein MP228_008686 [Amoeboaphelidium protococcarum]
MFYSVDFLGKNTGHNIGLIWLAACNSRSKKKDYVHVDLKDACSYVSHPPEPLALRLSGTLMYGISRVYQLQVQYFQNDVQTTLQTMRKTFYNVDIVQTLVVPQAKFDAITHGGISIPQTTFHNFNSDQDAPSGLISSNGNANLEGFGWLKRHDQLVQFTQGAGDAAATEVEIARFAKPKSVAAYSSDRDSTLLKEDELSAMSLPHSIAMISGSGAGNYSVYSDNFLDKFQLDVGSIAQSATFGRLSNDDQPSVSNFDNYMIESFKNSVLESASKVSSATKRSPAVFPVEQLHVEPGHEQKVKKAKVVRKKIIGLDKHIELNIGDFHVVRQGFTTNRLFKCLTTLRSGLPAGKLAEFDVSSRLPDINMDQMNNQESHNRQSDFQIDYNVPLHSEEVENVRNAGHQGSSVVHEQSRAPWYSVGADSYGSIQLGNEVRRHEVTDISSIPVSTLTGYSDALQQKQLGSKKNSVSSNQSKYSSGGSTLLNMAGGPLSFDVSYVQSFSNGQQSSLDEGALRFRAYAYDIIQNSDNTRLTDFLPVNPAREVVAEVFYNLLMIKTRGEFELDQYTPYCDIHVSIAGSQ